MVSLTRSPFFLHALVEVHAQPAIDVVKRTDMRYLHLKSVVHFGFQDCFNIVAFCPSKLRGSYQPSWHTYISMPQVYPFLRVILPSQ